MGSADAVFIIGAGHFGGRAARLLADARKGPIFVVDVDAHRLSELHQAGLRHIADDGIGFLVRHYAQLHAESTIVPALPVHLAYEWVALYLAEAHVFKKVEVPDSIRPFLPHTWPAGDGSLLASFADFICPDDCAEPDCCTVTGEFRDPPLHDLLRGLPAEDFNVHVTRSRQLAPGLGGYRSADLGSVASSITRRVPGRWLLCTACRCHGVVTAFEIRRRPECF
jgi:hypothetical protein